MSSQALSAAEAVQRLSRRDPTLKCIILTDKRQTDEELAELADCLLTHPDVVAAADLSGNELTDETGVKLARYLAASSTVEWLGLRSNQFGSATYLAVAAALRLNSSLRILLLYNNQAVDQTRIDAALVEALRLNPVRPVKSVWRFFSFSNDFHRLKHAAEQLGHPTMQTLLALRC